jgi:hypothetical protein
MGASTAGLSGGGGGTSEGFCAKPNNEARRAIRITRATIKV